MNAALLAQLFAARAVIDAAIVLAQSEAPAGHVEPPPSPACPQCGHADEPLSMMDGSKRCKRCGTVL